MFLRIITSILYITFAIFVTINMVTIIKLNYLNYFKKVDKDISRVEIKRRVKILLYLTVFMILGMMAIFFINYLIVGQK